MLTYVPDFRMLAYRGDPIVIYDGEPDSIVHLPLRGLAFAATSEEVNAVQRLCDNPTTGIDIAPTARALIEAIQSLSSNDASQAPAVEALETYQPTEATLILTETCNLGCGYCYAASMPTKSAPMKLELAKVAVDEVVRNAERSDKKLAQIRYIGGGEPTITWGLLTEVQAYFEQQCSNKGVLAWSRLVTNGTLLTENRVEWLAEHVSFVTLSFDVLPELQAARSYVDGRSTQSRLLETIHLLTKHNVAFHVRATVGAQAAERLVDMVEYLAEHTKATHVRLEPMAEIGRARSTDLKKPTDEVFFDQFILARQRGQELGIAVTCKLFNNTARVGVRFCEAEFSVSPTGHLSGCHRYSRPDNPGFGIYEYGTLSESGSVDVDLSKLNRLRSINASSFDDCKQCPAQWNCASGCLSARTRDGKVQQHGPLCPLTRHLLKAAISERVLANRKSNPLGELLCN